MSARVRRHSSLTRELPKEIRAEVDRLLLEPGVTYDDIEQFLKGKGFDISRSAIGRYGKDYLSSYQSLRIAIDQARAMKGEVGEGLALEEAVANLALKQAMEGLMSGTIQVSEVPKILGEIGKLQASSTSREKFKAELQGKVVKVAEEVAKTAKKGGLSDEAANEIRRKILGIGA